MGISALFTFSNQLKLTDSKLAEWLTIPNWPQIFALCGVPLEESVKIPDAPLVVAFLNVGQGDCTFITTDTCDILIDAGEAENAELVLSYLDCKGVDDLEYIIATHPHSDHVGAIPKIMQSMETETLILSPKSAKTNDGDKYRDKLISTARKTNTEVVELPFDPDLQIKEEKLIIDILGPICDSDNLNNLSVVVKLSFGTTSFLFMGDAEKLEEYTLLSRDFEARIDNLRSDVLKVAHHGSSSSSDFDFISAVSPEFAIISCGQNNDYGHPHTETLDTLKKQNISIYRTDLSGTIIITSDGSNLDLYKY